jgi:hypothetical protein
LLDAGVGSTMLLSPQGRDPMVQGMGIPPSQLQRELAEEKQDEYDRKVSRRRDRDQAKRGGKSVRRRWLPFLRRG